MEMTVDVEYLEEGLSTTQLPTPPPHSPEPPPNPWWPSKPQIKARSCKHTAGPRRAAARGRRDCADSDGTERDLHRGPSPAASIKPRGCRDVQLRRSSAGCDTSSRHIAALASAPTGNFCKEFI
ncbi:unnamed protein product [Pleuronectes platessa]|uniref:Uncharacterized protein n=1 Tax=Pleuronectes platessa TaxID=8262 RepID=A0A9N7TSW6_PLEPL|nr:unnamed protein product [Pleuronectes platessa]